MIRKILHLCDCFAGLCVKNSPRNREGVLWIYGDSNAGRFYRSIRQTPLCKTVFRSCTFSYNWIYPKKRYSGDESKKFSTNKHNSCIGCNRQCYSFTAHERRKERNCSQSWLAFYYFRRIARLLMELWII